MNTLRLFAAATLLAACPLSAFSQNTVSAAPAAPTPVPTTPAISAVDTAKPVTLRFKFTPGETLYYSMVADTDGTILTGQSGAGIPIKNHMQMLMHQTVKDVRATDGAATIEAGIDSMTMSMNGQTLPMPPDKLAQMKTVGTMVILPTGKTLSFTPNPALGASMSIPGMDMSHANAIGNIGQLPDASVKAGDTWKSGVSMGMMGAQVASTFTLQSLDTSGGGNIAVIKQTTNGTFDMPGASAAAAAPMGMKMKGKVSGTGTLRFDVAKGSVEGQTSAANITMAMTPPGATAPMRLQMKVNSTMTHASAPAPASDATVQ